MISKAEKKRRAKAARQAAEKAEKERAKLAAAVPTPPKGDTDGLAVAPAEAKSQRGKHSEAKVNGKLDDSGFSAKTNGTAMDASADRAATVSPTKGADTKPETPAVSAAAAPSPSSNGAAASKTSSSTKQAAGATHVPTERHFSPELPDTLPTPDMLPSNRKRKTPGDFTPTGPRDATTPSSKIGVKFEDGVAPGEGKEGEKTMPKKNQNVVERTIWTFIMIFGFIGTSGCKVVS